MDFPAGSPVFRSLLVFLEALNQGSTQKPYRFRPGFRPSNFKTFETKYESLTHAASLLPSLRDFFANSFTPVHHLTNCSAAEVGASLHPITWSAWKSHTFLGPSPWHLEMFIWCCPAWLEMRCAKCLGGKATNGAEQRGRDSTVQLKTCVCIH